MTDTDQPQAQYRDDDLVYVDPETKTVIGPIEWSRNGNPKSMPVPPKPEDKEKGKRRRSERKFYPWGTYRSMKHAYSLEGKQKRSEANITFDEAIAKGVDNPF